jgi:hypothetical protein
MFMAKGVMAKGVTPSAICEEAHGKGGNPFCHVRRYTMLDLMKKRFEEHPELHSVDEAKAYMDSINFHHNHETYVVGGGVKEKYPHTDKKVVIEWERSEKTEK